MSNIDQRFFYALLTANRLEQERFRIQNIPVGVFKISSREARWIYRHRDRHGHYPSVKLYNTTFSEEPLKRNTDSLKATLQPVLDMAMFAQMQAVTTQAKDMLEKTDDVGQAMAVFRQGSSTLRDYNVDYVDVDFSKHRNAVRAYKQRVKLFAEGSKQLLLTPWPRITKMVKYYSGGDTVVIAARTSIGKTWLVCEWVDYYAKRGIKTLLITKEMSTEKMEERMEAKRFKLPYDQLREGTLPPKVLRRWMAQRRASVNAPFESYPLIISGDETIQGVGISHVISKIEQYKPAAVFVDGAYLLTPEGVASKLSERERFVFLSNRFKAVAKATGTLIFLILQMNRNAEKADTTKGSIKDVYGSDAWGQDADGVYELNGQRGSTKRNLVLLKGRDSAIGEVVINFRLDPPDLSESLTQSRNAPKGSSGKEIKFKGV